MKQFLVVPALLIAAASFFSCKSAPAAEPATVPLTDGLSETEAVFQGIYGAYQTDFILDNAQKYTVQSGDKLVNIARKLYGEEYPYFFPLIMFASTDVVLDPNLVVPGMVLTVPDLHKNLASPEIRLRIKKLLEDIALAWTGRGVTAADKEGMRKAAASL
jgi:hypothetical protein